jgi:hypothetical protein
MEPSEIRTIAAKAAHEVNRAYCEACGDMSQLPWEEAPTWAKESALLGVLQINEHPDTTPEQSHEGWLKVKKEDGWKFGLVKDADKKEHPCFVPYSMLPVQQKIKDVLFGTTVRAVLEHYGLLPTESI